MLKAFKKLMKIAKKALKSPKALFFQRGDGRKINIRKRIKKQKNKKNTLLKINLKESQLS